jgi:hypothetical protein
MPSKTQRKIQFARERQVFVFRLPRDWWESSKKSWGVYAEGEWSPRGPMTRRAAKNLAYAISVSKKVELIVTMG